jgi:hypothetical protein
VSWHSYGELPEEIRRRFKWSAVFGYFADGHPAGLDTLAQCPHATGFRWREIHQNPKLRKADCKSAAAFKANAT